ncbi:unnamed protein product [Amoebophrya sp. A25]|nr:unnamed protein product [Amoebophrya sp. A25]|eukprot:GSA25T00018495001.1
MAPAKPRGHRILLFTRRGGDVLCRLEAWLMHYERLEPTTSVLILTASETPIRSTGGSKTASKESSVVASEGAHDQGQSTSNATSTSASAIQQNEVRNTSTTLPLPRSASSTQVDMSARSTPVVSPTNCETVSIGKGVVEQDTQNRSGALNCDTGIAQAHGDGVSGAPPSITPSNGTNTAASSSSSSSTFSRYTIMQPRNRKETLAISADFQPDLIVSVLYPKMIFPEVLSLVPKGLAVNIHPSLLPLHRGSLCQFWPIYEGDTISGVTLHEMVETFDDGPLYHQVPARIDPMYETALSLNRKILNCIETCFAFLLRKFYLLDEDAREMESGGSPQKSLEKVAQGPHKNEGNREEPEENSMWLQVRRQDVFAKMRENYESCLPASVLDKLSDGSKIDDVFPYHFKKFPNEGIISLPGGAGGNSEEGAANGLTSARSRSPLLDCEDRVLLDRFIRAMYFPPKPCAMLRHPMTKILVPVRSLAEFDRIMASSSC